MEVHQTAGSTPFAWQHTPGMGQAAVMFLTL